MHRELITKKINDKWLNFILDGSKTVEGRLNKEGFWINLKSGDRFIFVGRGDLNDVKLKVIIEVTEIKKFKDFGEAFDSLGSTLVPIKDINKDEVVTLYREFYSDDIVRKNGVLAIGVKVIEKL